MVPNFLGTTTLRINIVTVSEAVLATQLINVSLQLVNTVINLSSIKPHGTFMEAVKFHKPTAF